jgi:hypothetical protein
VGCARRHQRPRSSGRGFDSPRLHHVFLGGPQAPRPSPACSAPRTPKPLRRSESASAFPAHAAPPPSVACGLLGILRALMTPRAPCPLGGSEARSAITRSAWLPRPTPALPQILRSRPTAAAVQRLTPTNGPRSTGQEQKCRCRPCALSPDPYSFGKCSTLTERWPAIWSVSRVSARPMTTRWIWFVPS